MEFKVNIPKQKGGVKRFYEKKDLNIPEFPESLKDFHASIIAMGYQELYYDHSMDTSIMVGVDPNNYIVVGELQYGQKSFKVNAVEEGKINALMSLLDKEYATFLDGPLRPKKDTMKAVKFIQDSHMGKGYETHTAGVVIKHLGIHSSSLFKVEEESAGIKHVKFRDVMINMEDRTMLMCRDVNYPLFLGEAIVDWVETISQAREEKIAKATKEKE